MRWAEECKQRPSNTFPLQNTQMREQTSNQAVVQPNYHNESKIPEKSCAKMTHIAQSLQHVQSNTACVVLLSVDVEASSKMPCFLCGVRWAYRWSAFATFVHQVSLGRWRRQKLWRTPTAQTRSSTSTSPSRPSNRGWRLAGLTCPAAEFTTQILTPLKSLWVRLLHHQSNGEVKNPLKEGR